MSYIKKSIVNGAATPGLFQFSSSKVGWAAESMNIYGSAGSGHDRWIYFNGTSMMGQFILSATRSSVGYGQMSEIAVVGRHKAVSFYVLQKLNPFDLIKAVTDKYCFSREYGVLLALLNS